MQVILLKDVSKVGRKYEEKEVASGYAINFLIPNGMAEVATAGNKKKFTALRSLEVASHAAQEKALAENLKKIEEKPIQLSGKANDKGHLFAGIGADVLAAEISKALGVHISPELIHLEKPLKEVGEHIVEIKAGEKKAKLKVLISALEK